MTWVNLLDMEFHLTTESLSLFRLLSVLYPMKHLNVSPLLGSKFLIIKFGQVLAFMFWICY